MKTTRQMIRYTAAAFGLGALALLGATSLAGAPAPAVSVVAKAHPAAGPTYAAPTVPPMDFGQTQGEPPPTVPAPAQR